MVDLTKLKLDKFHRISVFNFPKSFDLGIPSINSNPEVIIYFINKVEDIEKFVSLCNSTSFPKDNRTIMVYEKGRKDINRDSIITPFRNGTHPKFIFKAPMLCSLSEKLSAFVLAKES